MIQNWHRVKPEKKLQVGKIIFMTGYILLYFVKCIQTRQTKPTDIIFTLKIVGVEIQMTSYSYTIIANYNHLSLDQKYYIYIVSYNLL